MSEPLPMDMSNLSLSCRPLSQTSELQSSQVFLAEKDGVDVRVRMRPDDAALCTLMVGGPAFDPTGAPLAGTRKEVPSHKLHLPSAALVTGVRSAWEVLDSNGTDDVVQVRVHVVRGFDMRQVVTFKTKNTAMRMRKQLLLATDARNNAIATMYARAAGPAAALTMLAGQMSVNSGQIGPPREQYLLGISEEALLGPLKEYCRPRGPAVQAAGPAGPTQRARKTRSRQAARQAGRQAGRQGADAPPGPGAPQAPGAPPGPGAAHDSPPKPFFDNDDNPPKPFFDSGNYDPLQVYAIQQALVERCLPTYLHMGMPAVYGVAAKLADHLGLPRDGQELQSLADFLQQVERQPAWTRAVHNLFKVSLAELWSARTKYSMDPAVAIGIGPTGAMLQLHGPGEVQAISGQIGIGSRWVRAKRQSMAVSWKAVEECDCEDGASLFACVMHALGCGARMHPKQRDMFAGMPGVMPETDRYCARTQECAARIMLMVGAEHNQKVNGVAFVAASAASAEQASDGGGGNKGSASSAAPGQRPDDVCLLGSGPRRRQNAAVCDTWLRLVKPSPDAGGHAVFFDASFDEALTTTTDVDCGAMGTATFRVKKLRQSRPLESTALVYPAPESNGHVLRGINVRNGQQQVLQIMGPSEPVPVERCQSMCSAVLAQEASKMLHSGAQANPVFVQSIGSPGFYIGNFNIGDHLLLTHTNEKCMQRLRSMRTLTIDEPMLQQLCDETNKLSLQQVAEQLQSSEISAWARYEDMGAGAKPAKDNVYALHATLFASEKAACHTIAAHAAAEVPSVETLRAFCTAPLSIRDMRLRTLLPPVQCRAPAPRTSCRLAPVAPPSEFWGENVPVMLAKRDATGMSSARDKHDVVRLAEELGACLSRQITQSCAVAQFVMQAE